MSMARANHTAALMGVRVDVDFLKYRRICRSSMRYRNELAQVPTRRDLTAEDLSYHQVWLEMPYPRTLSSAMDLDDTGNKKTKVPPPGYKK